MLNIIVNKEAYVLFNGAIQHYNQYYYYSISSEIDPGKKVNSLFEAVCRNDNSAIEEVSKILASNTYYLVCNRLENGGCATRENVDEVMQNVQFEFMKATFRGFPEYVTSDRFYGWLLGVVENCAKNFKKRDKQKGEVEEFEGEGYTIQDCIEARSDTENGSSPEQDLLAKEKDCMIECILRKYIIALQESKMMPHQLLTYCYAVVIPQLIKKTNNIELLKKIDKISGRKKQPPNSHYNDETNQLEGEINRNSVILINWAMEAMYKMRVEQLDSEFLEIYNLEKIADMDFDWGMHYKSNMEREVNGILEKKVIITPDGYHQNTIKNWPIRVAKSLISDTEKQLLADKDIVEKSVNLVEEMLR